MSGSSRCRLTQPNVGDPLPSLHGHYTRFITTTEQSAPLRRIGTFGLAVGAACAFSLGIAGQVLTFRTRAWLSFAPSTPQDVQEVAGAGFEYLGRRPEYKEGCDRHLMQRH